MEQAFENRNAAEDTRAMQSPEQAVGEPPAQTDAPPALIVRSEDAVLYDPMPDQPASAPDGDAAPSPAPAQAVPEKKDTRFKPGQSGNPSGRPKRTQEEKDALEELRSLAPEAIGMLGTMLRSKRVSASVRLKVIEEILNRTYGKPESSLKVESVSVSRSIEESRAYLIALTEEIQKELEEEDDGR